MKKNLYFNKIYYIYKEEGISILFKRIFRYIIYLIRRGINNNRDDKKKWEKIKNKHLGNRAFIIGNGPSLNLLPLHLLKNEFTMCFNRFDLMIERLQWTPSAYTVIDDLVLDDTSKIINSMTDDVEYAFFPDIHPSAPVNKNYKNIIHSKENVYWLHLNNIGFTNNLPDCGINKSVANVAVQILAFMGFSEIYFIGVDLDYKIPDSVISVNSRELTGGEDDDPNHFDPRYFGKGKKYHYPRMDETFEKFDEASIFLNDNGIKGYNAGIGGKLEAFERVEFRKLFNLSKIDELKLMIRHVINDISSENLEDLFPNAKVVQNIADWDDDYEEIICSFTIGFKIIPQKIFDFIPFGPYQDRYIFIKRGCALLN